MKQKDTIVIGSDHAGFNLKEYVKKILQRKRYVVNDVGTYGRDSVDYPDFAAKVAVKVARIRKARGVLVCATGIGASIAANKVRGIRAALVKSVREARLSRRHNDANILVLGGRPFNRKQTARILQTWLTTDFQGGRHARRVRKIMRLERKRT